jgi:hypothetical protein
LPAQHPEVRRKGEPFQFTNMSGGPSFLYSVFDSLVDIRKSHKVAFS